MRAYSEMLFFHRMECSVWFGLGSVGTLLGRGARANQFSYSTLIPTSRSIMFMFPYSPQFQNMPTPYPRPIFERNPCLCVKTRKRGERFPPTDTRRLEGTEIPELGNQMRISTPIRTRKRRYGSVQANHRPARTCSASIRGCEQNDSKAEK